MTPAFAALLLLSAVAQAASADQRLVEAVKDRDRAAITQLLRTKVDVNVRSADGATALHWAAHWDDGETVTSLLSKGADPNAANDYGITPLAIAAVNGDTAIVEVLLKSGARPDLAATTGVTPLMLAARTGSVTAVETLLSHGADPSAVERTRGQDALMWAVSQQHPDVVRTLIAHKADVNARSLAGYTPLTFAARVGDLASARLLLAAGADVNRPIVPVTPRVALQSSAGRNGPPSEDFARAVADQGSPLLVAAYSGHSKLALLFLEHGADVNPSGPPFSPLHVAVLAGDRPLLEALLAKGADVDAEVTKGFGGRGMFTQDLAMGRNLVGATPLMLAAAYDEPEMMRILIAHGSDPRHLTRNNVTPLMAAAGLLWADGLDRRGRESFVQADALADSSVEAVTIALGLGGDINAVNVNGETALHAAASKGLNKVIELLVAHGARVDIKDKKGMTPLQMTRGRRYDDHFDPEFAGEQSVRRTTADLLKKLGATE